MIHVKNRILKKSFLLLSFFFIANCYSQQNNTCDYNISDTSFMNNMVRLGEQEWKKIKETSRVIVKDTLGLDSLLLVYYKNGQLYSREPYKNGKLCGYYEEYYSNGQLRFREYRKIGGIPEDCYFYCYDIDGSILQEGKIKNGVQVGVWIHYTFRAPFKQYIYSNNGKLKKIKTWDEDLKKWKRTGFM